MTDDLIGARDGASYYLQMLYYCSDDNPKPQRYTIGGSEVLVATCLLAAAVVDVDHICHLTFAR